VSRKDKFGSRRPTKLEHRIIDLVARGFTNREIADSVGTTEQVVKNYLRIIYDKVGLWNRLELALWYEAKRHRRQRGCLLR
jgi:DNA-binding NarL/FixJ family response regulator